MIVKTTIFSYKELKRKTESWDKKRKNFSLQGHHGQFFLEEGGGTSSTTFDITYCDEKLHRDGEPYQLSG